MPDLVQLSAMNEVDGFFGLAQPAFGPVIEPRQIFRSGLMGPLVKEVIAGAAVVSIRGAQGAGKTSFMHVLAMELAARNLSTAVVDGSGATGADVQRVLAGLAGLSVWDLPPERLLRALWHEAGVKRLVLLCDNAETYAEEMFRYLAGLLKLRVSQPIVLQLVLIGEAGTWPGLEAPDLDALRLASSISYTTLSLRKDEASAYLDHRLRLAGQTLGRVMTPSAAAELREQAHCNPRRLDELAQLALVHGYRTGRRRLTGRSVRAALLAGHAAPARSRRWVLPLAGGAFVLVAAGGVAAWIYGDAGHAPVVVAHADLVRAAPLPARIATAPKIVGRAALKPLPSAIQAPVVVATATAPVIAPVVAPPPVVAKGGDAGLVLVAGPRDDLKTLYARVYRGVTPPPYQMVVAANQMPVRPGSLVIFPEPPNGWSGR